MARTSIAVDDFNRADGNIGSNWTYIREIAWQANPPGISANKFFGRATNTHYQVARWAGTGTFTDDQYSKVTLSGFAYWSITEVTGVVARCSADTDANADFYFIKVASDTSGPNYTTIVGKMVNGTETVLNSVSRAWANGDTVELECEGTTIRAMKNGTAFYTTTDTSLTTGKPGILAGSGTLFGDDWDGGNLVSGATATAAWTEGADVVAVSVTVGSGAVTATAAWTEAADTVAITGTASVVMGTITTPVLKNNTGTILANETGVVVNVYNSTTGALVVQKTGQTSSAGGIVTVTDALIVPATVYAYEVKLTSLGRRLPVATAS